MNAKELIEIVSDKTHFNITDIEIVFDCIINEIININQKQKNVTITGFGTFKIKRIKATTRRRHDSNTEFNVKNYKYIKFIPAKKYKKKINIKPQP